MEQLALFRPGRPTVRASTYEEAGPLIRRWHYSGCVPRGRNLFYVVQMPSGPLYAAAAYGWGVNPYQETYLSRVLGREVTRGNCLEIKRLARVEPAVPSLPLTWFLARVHRDLRRRGVRYIVAFSDPAHGHSGGIYRAANFVHAGQTKPEDHCVDQDGNPVHRRVAYRLGKRSGISTAEAREQLGLQTVKTPPKDRWLLDLRRDLRREQITIIPIPG